MTANSDNSRLANASYSADSRSLTAVTAVRPSRLRPSAAD
jgi:hypothetical protein